MSVAGGTTVGVGVPARRPPVFGHYRKGGGLSSGYVRHPGTWFSNGQRTALNAGCTPKVCNRRPSWPSDSVLGLAENISQRFSFFLLPTRQSGDYLAKIAARRQDIATSLVARSARSTDATLSAR